MRNNGALQTHLHHFDQRRRKLRQVKQEVAEALDRLQLLYDTATAIGTTQQHRDDGRRDHSHDTKSHDVVDRNGPSGMNTNRKDVMNDVVGAYRQNRGLLNDALAFLDVQTQTLVRYRRDFQRHYPLEVRELRKRNSRAKEDPERRRRKKEAAVAKKNTRLKNFDLLVDEKLAESEQRRELEAVVKELQRALEGGVSDRGRQQAKGPPVSLRRSAGGCSSERPNRASSASKERMLSKAKLLRATKPQVFPSSSSCLTPRWTWGKRLSSRERAEKTAGSVTSCVDSGEHSQRAQQSSAEEVNDSEGRVHSSSAPEAKGRPAGVIQVPKVSSSV